MVQPPHEQTPKDIMELFELSKYMPNFPKNFIPPKFKDPHYEPPSREMSMVIMAATTFFISSFFFFLRIFVRWRTKSFGHDDWTMALAWVGGTLNYLRIEG